MYAPQYPSTFIIHALAWTSSIILFLNHHDLAPEEKWHMGNFIDSGLVLDPGISQTIFAG
jgi:hypothetical protein